MYITNIILISILVLYHIPIPDPVCVIECDDYGCYIICL